MNFKEIRQTYIDFFKARQHQEIASYSLIPENDPSLLFTNSGMFPLVPYLLGESHPAGQRLVDIQKCFRAEDIDEVGDNRHNTFFEMLGNWSLGDYFKEEQLNWYYQWLVEVLKIDPSKLYQTVYAGDGQVPKDQESIDICQKIFAKYNILAEEGDHRKASDFSKQRIFSYLKQNWWQKSEAIGELGGPDSETFYDTGKKHDSKFGQHCHPNCDCGRFIEIGNSVFMQYQKTADGWQVIENKNVDFGGGLERMAMILQGKDNVFETDLFINIIKKIENLADKQYQDNLQAFEIIADHLKAAVFIMGDDKNIVPSNTDQGYIIRRLIRRAIRYGRQLEIKQKNWTQEVAKVVIDDFKDIYPELFKHKVFIIKNLIEEEVKFAKTLASGLKEFQKLSGNISAQQAFNLYQTYGFPIEITKELAEEKGLSVDEVGFEVELAKHQVLSRTASVGKFQGGLIDQSEAVTKLHTATHLLLAALRQILGNHVYQKGSNITADRLRLDFSHTDKMTEEEKQKVEELVNLAIRASLDINCEEKSLSEAKSMGAMGVFESKYNDQVKVYTVGQNKQIASQEICGGPHVDNTNQLGHFKIKKEESSSSGVRRIKAVLE